MSIILKKVLHLSFSSGLAAIANILALVVASRYLTVGDYATFRQTFLVVETLIPILSLGIPGTIYYSLAQRNDKLNLFFETLVVIVFISSLFGLFIACGGNVALAIFFHNQSLVETLRWVVIYPIVQIPIQLITSILVYEGKTWSLAVLTTLSTVFVSLAIIYYATVYRRYEYLVIAKTLIPIIFLCMFLYVVVKNLKKYKVDVSKNIYNNMNAVLAVSIPFGLASLISTLSLQLDKVLVSKYSSLEYFAIYSNGAMEIPLIGVLSGAISAVLIGDISDKIRKNNFAAAALVFKEAASKTALILFPLMVFFFHNASEFMVFLYSEKYALSAIPFKIYLLLVPIRIVVFGSALIALGKSKTILVRSFIELLLNFVLSTIMFRLIGVWGIAFASVIVTYFWSVPYNLYAIASGFNMKISELFNYRLLFKILSICLLVSPVISVYKIIELSNIVVLILSFITYSFLVIFSYYKFQLIGVNDIFNNFIRRK